MDACLGLCGGGCAYLSELLVARGLASVVVCSRALNDHFALTSAIVDRKRARERCQSLAYEDRCFAGADEPSRVFKHPWCCCGGSGAAQRSSGGCSRLRFDFTEGADGAEGAKAGALGRRATRRDDDDVQPIRLRPPLPLHSPPGGKRRAALIIV